jgi:hypothetical protein
VVNQQHELAVGNWPGRFVLCLIRSLLRTKPTSPPPPARNHPAPPRQINTAGLQAWTLIVNLKDTPEGLKIDNELIIGAAAAGYDKADPSEGAPAAAAQVVNDNLIKPMFDTFAKGDEFMASINAITRHVTEEFSMFRFFLPTVWNRFPHLHGMFAMSDALTSMMPRLNYGPFMKVKSLSSAGLTEMMMPLNRTALGNLTALAGAVKAMPSAIATGAGMNINANVQGLARDYATVSGAFGSKNVTAAKDAIVRVKVPSYTGK